MKKQHIIFGVALIAVGFVAYKLGAKKEHDKAASVIDPLMSDLSDAGKKLNEAVAKGWSAKQYRDSLNQK